MRVLLRRASIIIIVVLIAAVSFTISALLTFAQFRASQTERALLETENTARRLAVALASCNLHGAARAEPPQRVLAAQAPSAALWGLQRWPLGSEIFLATHGQTSYLIQRASDDSLEFTTINPRQLFRSAMGSLTNVEWLFADRVSTTEASLATQESSEARQLSGSSIHSATVAIPGTNTLLRRHFFAPLTTIFQDSLVWWVPAALTLLASGTFLIGLMAQRKVAPQTLPSTTTLRSKENLLQRLVASINNELIGHQCLILMSIDRTSYRSSHHHRTIIQRVSETLALLCNDGPLLALVSAGEAENSGRVLFGIHCPNVDKGRALQFAESCRIKAETHPELALQTPAITLSAAVSEIHRTSAVQVDSETILKDLLAATLTALDRAEENGGGMSEFACSVSIEAKGAA